MGWWVIPFFLIPRDFDLRRPVVNIPQNETIIFHSTARQVDHAGGRDSAKIREKGCIPPFHP